MERETGTVGTMEPRALLYAHHQIEQTGQGPREVKGLTRGHTAVEIQTPVS